MQIVPNGLQDKAQAVLFAASEQLCKSLVLFRVVEIMLVQNHPLLTKSESADRSPSTNKPFTNTPTTMSAPQPITKSSTTNAIPMGHAVATPQPLGDMAVVDAHFDER